MNKYIQKVITNVFIGIVIGVAFGLLLGLSSGPHRLVTSDWTIQFVRAGAIAGGVSGVVVGVINIALYKRDSSIIGMGQKLSGVTKGAIFGGTVGVMIAAIVGIVKISVNQSEPYFFWQIVEIYYIPVIGVIFGGGYGLSKSAKWKNDLCQSIISGVGFGLISSILLSLFMIFLILSNLRDVITITTIFLPLILIALICLSLFGMVISVVSEAVTGRLTKAITQTKSVF